MPAGTCPLTTVHTGSVTIATADDLAALACVRELRGALVIAESSLQHLTGLERLEVVHGGIEIRDNPDLVDLTGLCGLVAIETWFAETSGGDLRIQFNPKLIDLDDLGRLERVAGELLVRENSALASLAGLARLEAVGERLVVRDSGALVDLRGLERLTAVNQVEIFRNDGLESLCGLHGLRTVGSLDVSDNGALETLVGLHNLDSVSVALAIAGNAGLVDLTGLQGLGSAGAVHVLHNPALASLAGLDALQQVGRLVVAENDALVDWQAPPALDAVGHLEICGNDALTGLAGSGLLVERLTVTYNDPLSDAAATDYAAALGVSGAKIARNTPPPYAPLSPCPWSGDGTCDEDEWCMNDWCVLCEDDCCGDWNPTDLCAPDTDAPADCPDPVGPP